MRVKISATSTWKGVSLGASESLAGNSNQEAVVEPADVADRRRLGEQLRVLRGQRTRANICGRRGDKP